MTDNLVKFPNKPTQVFPSTQEESFKRLEEVRQEFCDEVTSDVLDAMIAVLNSYGFTIKTEHNHVKDIVFLEEAIKALTYRFKKLEHPLHEIIESTISIKDEDSPIEPVESTEVQLNN
jgi:hypothetical protein